MLDYDEYLARVLEFQSRPAWSENYTRVLQRAMASLPDDPKVIDFGCGPGRFTEMLRLAGAAVRGVDYDEGMIEEARLKNPNAEFSQYLMARGDADAVFCMHVLGHVQNLQHTIWGIKDALKPDGMLIVLNPNRAHTLRRKPIDWIKGYASDPTILHRWTLPELSTQLRAHSLYCSWCFWLGEPFLGAAPYFAACYRKML